MIVIGLTGGIGSGKSTVARMLVQRGAVLIDADEVAHDVVGVGRPAYRKVVERFGESVAAPDGSIDRAALASVVFNDAAALADLEAIVHPEVRSEIGARIAAESGSEHVVVVDIPLLIEKGDPDGYRLAGVLVVDSPLDIAVERLVNLRRMDRSDAKARIARQATRSERIGRADFVIMNMGTLEELEEMVRRAWEWIERLRVEGPDGDRPAGGTG
jgi:dephospho-CoA kinase